MKSVLISIQPKYCELIASGKKTIEVRKSRPKIETPFKCYIYVTKPKKWFRFSDWGYASDECLWLSNGKVKMCDGFEFWAEGKEYEPLCCKVIGEFVCDRIVGYYPYGLRGFELSNEVLKNMCLSNKDLNEYGKLDRVYGWHISDLKIYDKPKPLTSFYKPCRIEWKNCPGCELYSTYTGCCMNNVDRPPQSYMYVEEV